MSPYLLVAAPGSGTCQFMAMLSILFLRPVLTPQVKTGSTLVAHPCALGRMAAIMGWGRAVHVAVVPS